MGVLDEIRKLFWGAIADFRKVSSPWALVCFIANGILNETQKVFGNRPLLWNSMYWLFSYRQKMTDESQQARYHGILEEMKEAPKQHPGAAVLDVGCGIANAIPIWLEAGIGSYEGLDIANSAIEEARRIYARDTRLATRFETTSIADYDHQDRLFDFIVFNEVLYYLKPDAAAVAAVETCLKMLKPGGAIIVSMSDGHHSDKVWQGLATLPVDVGKKRRVDSGCGNLWNVSSLTLLQKS